MTAPMTLVSEFTSNARYANPATEHTPPNNITVTGCIRPEGSGRSAVRFIFASYSRSSNWFNAEAPLATSAVPNNA